MDNEQRRKALAHLHSIHRTLTNLLPSCLMEDLECEGFSLASVEKIKSEIQIITQRIELLRHDIKNQPITLTGKEVKLQQTETPVNGNIGILCNSSACIHRRDCAQHVSAGDYRSEDGNTPLIFEHNNEYYCPMNISKTDRGMLTVEDDELVLAFKDFYNGR